MPEISFMQFMRPDGHKEPSFIDRPQAIYEKAQKILDAGYVFECEVLRTGHVSVSIADPDEDDVAIRVASNGPAVLAAVDDLIMSFKVPE